MLKTKPLIISMLTILTLLGIQTQGQATLLGYSVCAGAVSCDVTSTPPALITKNPNDGILLGWDEVQNFTLTEDLRVDRVADPSAPFVTPIGSDYLIQAGTIVASHYFQWDPIAGGSNRVDATIDFDSEIFAFITSDQNLFDSDAFLGLPSVDYADFGLRGLEAGDTTNFSGPSVDISWSASSPGDWTRVITAYSPQGNQNVVPEPATMILFGSGLLGLVQRKRKK